MAINVGDNFNYQGRKYLDGRQSFKTLQELQSYTEVPEGFIAYCEENTTRYEYKNGEWIEYIVNSSSDVDLSGYAEKTYVDNLIETHTHDEYLTSHQDISHLATKEQLNVKFDNVEVNYEETTDAQTALDFFANGSKVKTVYFSGGSGGTSTSPYISTTLPEDAMVETGMNFDILLDFYSPNPGKGTLKVFVNDIDVLSTSIIQGESTTTLTSDKFSKGTNKVVVYVLDRVGIMSNSLTFYVRYGSTELVSDFDSSISYDYGATIRYYFTATALDTSLSLTFYMSIDGALQEGVSCTSDVRGYFTFRNTLEPGGHYCECWVEDSNGSKSNVDSFNLVILDLNTLAIVSGTKNISIEEGAQLSLDYRVYKKNETTFIVKTYVDEELVNTGTCGLTTSFYKTSKLKEGIHVVKVEAWDITETISDYVTWTVTITPSTYTMIEPIEAGSIFMATAQNRTNSDGDREVWTGYDQDGRPINATLINFAFNSESGWMDDQLFITGNSYVEVPIQPLANNARYGFTLDIEFLTKPIGVDDAEVLTLWNDIDNCGIKITTEQVILQSKSGNKCELYFTENEMVSAIFIIDRNEKTAKIYLNGVMCAAFALSDYAAEGVSYLEEFTVNDNVYIGGKGKNGYSSIKNLRIYELALSTSEILDNFISNTTDKAAQQELVNFQKGDNLPTVTVYCDFSGLGKDDKKYCDIIYNSPDPVLYGESFALTGKYSQLQYQGTSSMQYPIKNYRLNPRDANGKVKIRLPFSQPESRFTLKADFMASGHWQNTGLTKWVNDNLYNYNENDEKSMNPAKWWALQNGIDPDEYRECIYGFPCRLILINDGTSPLNEGQQEPTPGNTKDMGIFNFNLDKECENTLGFTIDAFPNAVSMEVTANSDTSAGAFMSFKQHYTLEFVDTPTCLECRIENFLDVGEHNIGGILPELYTYNTVHAQVSSNNYGKSPKFTTTSDIATLLIRFLDKTVETFSIDGVFYDVAVVDKASSSDCELLPPSGDELAYIQESFELRYGNEDIEGWGFLGMEVDLPQYIFDYDRTSDYKNTTIFPTTFFNDSSITVVLKDASDWSITYYNANKVWVKNSDRMHSGDTVSIDKSLPYMRIVDLTGGSTAININGVDYLYGENLTGTPLADLFKEPYTSGATVKGWSTEHSLKRLIDWVDNSTDEQFISEFEEHFHKDYTLRYYLLVITLGMVDNLGKNMMLDSYDGKIWMPRFYDCDTICSYDNSGAIKFDVDIEMAQGYWNTSSSRLWTRIRDLFHEELVAKYNDMRQNGLSFESLMSYFYDEQIAKIPQKYYNMDADVKYLPYADEYLGKAHGDGYEHLKRWLKNRLIFTDTLYDYAPSYTNDMITLRANTTNLMELTIETYTPVYQHVSWYNGQMDKEKINKGTRHTFSGYAQAATDQEVLIYGGSNIKRIIGISSMNPNSMLIGNATRLVELDISDCPILTDINSNKANLSAHTYLNKVDVSNCPMLGGTLRLNYSPLIQEVNAMNTAITDMQLPSSIRNLHTLKLPGALKTLTLNDAPLLENLEFDGPNVLQSVSMTNCNALKNVVNFDMTQIPIVTLNNSYDEDELYMSKTTNLSLVNMANIKKLIFIPNNEHESFNLTELRNSPDYMISAINCPNLKTFMTTTEYRNSYKNGEYGDVKPNTAFCANTLDISNTKITDVNFLCTTDIYQLKLPNTVNNFICDSAYDLDTDYLPDGDFDMVHHEFIEAYTTDYNNAVTLPAIETGSETTGEVVYVEDLGSGRKVTDFMDITGAYEIRTVVLDASGKKKEAWHGYYLYDSNKNQIVSADSFSGEKVIIVPSNAKYIKLQCTWPSDVSNLQFTTYRNRPLNLITSAADGSLIFSMYAPTVNTAVPAEGIWDLYGLTFEEFYTYGMNNDIVVSGDNVIMPHRYSDYNITIQNANIKPTNYPTMLYPLLVNENKPITGTIDYTNYRGDDLSYTMAYANKSEVDIILSNDMISKAEYSYKVDDNSEYKYVDPNTILEYICNTSGNLPTFNNSYTSYKSYERDNGDGTYTTNIIADDISNLPSKIVFTSNTNLLEVKYANVSNIDDLADMFRSCTNLSRVQAAGWNTSKSISLRRMFDSCVNLVDITGINEWDISNVTDLASTFYGCASLTSLNVNNWDTSQVTSFDSIFRGCKSLTSLNVSDWDLSNATTVRFAFHGCTELVDLDISGWDTSNVQSFGGNGGGILSECPKLKSDKFPVLDFSNASSITRIINDSHSITELHFKNFGPRTTVFNDGYSTGQFIRTNNQGSLTTVTGLDLTYMTYRDEALTHGIINSPTLVNLTLEGTINVSFRIIADALSHDSLMNIINALATLDNNQSNTVNLGSTNLAKLTNAEIKIATDKGWTLI